MIRSMSRTRLIPVAAVLFSLLAPFGPGFADSRGVPAPSPPGRLRCDVVPKFLESYLQAHIVHKQMTPELRERTVDSYLRALDPSKTLLYASEAQAIREDDELMFGELMRGDCSYLFELQTRVHGRYQQLETLVGGLAGRDDFEIDPSVEIVIDPEERTFPKDENERNELIRRLVHFQVSNLVTGGEDLAEARRRLIHRYELMTKRSEEITQEDVLAVFVDAFARSLDPHSNYFSADAMEDFQIGMSLSLEGIGVALSSRDGYPVVERIIPGGATDRTDALAVEDKIIAVAQAGESSVSVVDMDLRDVVRMIRGRKGTTVRLTVLRQKPDTKRFNVTIVRDTVDLKEQAADLRWETRTVNGRTLKLGVIDLQSFYGDRSPGARRSSDDVRQLLKEAREGGADGLLLDLSRNGGGNLEYAVEISGLFIRQGGIVAIREASGRSKVMIDPDSDLHWKGPLVVLTSRISASASEILVGALKDYERAVLVGDSSTFGKGSVQTVIPLPPGLGAIKVTTAMFFRPGGASTQNDGVVPHVQIPSLWDREDFGEREQPFALPSQRMAPFEPAPGSRDDRRLGDFRRITPDLVKALQARSAGRVKTSEAFDEVVEKLAEADKKESRIRLAELLEKQESSQAAAEPTAGDAAVKPPEAPHADLTDDDEKPSIQVEEALDILADLAVLEGDPA
jgi:carboxyl-terminal processing protease